MPLYALTNWSAETFALTRREPAYAFLDLFRGIFVSGELRLMKPEPAIFRHALSRIGREAPQCLFIDDVEKNVAGAAAVGLAVHLFTTPESLAADLRTRGLLPRCASSGWRPALLLLVLVAAGVMAWLAWSSLPQLSGELRVAGLAGPVEVVRDRWGVPHIRAGSAEDAYRALGFVHAQDRLWQMEFNRRVGQGRLAEILGRDALPFDRLMRTLDLRGAAEASGRAPGRRGSADA